MSLDDDREITPLVDFRRVVGAHWHRSIRGPSGPARIHRAKTFGAQPCRCAVCGRCPTLRRASDRVSSRTWIVNTVAGARPLRSDCGREPTVRRAGIVLDEGSSHDAAWVSRETSDGSRCLLSVRTQRARIVGSCCSRMHIELCVLAGGRLRTSTARHSGDGKPLTTPPR